jgi:hypothetical protein
MAAKRTGFLQAIVAGLWLLATGTVAAQTAGTSAGRGTVDFTWEAPPECPSAAALQAEVARLSATTPSGQRWQARAIVTRSADDVWTLRLATEVDGRKDERDFVAASCAELAATAAVVLAIAVDPSPRQPASVPQATATAPSTSRAPRFPSLAITAGVSATAGALASPALGAELGVAWLPPKARLEVEGLWLPASDVSGARQGTAGSFSLLAAVLSACWSPLSGRIRPAPCLGVEAGRLEAEAEASPGVVPKARATPWVAGEAGGVLVVIVAPHVAVRARLDLLVPFVRDSFTISGIEPAIHTPSPVAGEASLGVEVEFP